MSAKKDQDLKKAKTFLDQINTKFEDFKALEQDPDALQVVNKVHDTVRQGVLSINNLIQAEVPDQNKIKVSDLPIQEGSRLEGSQRQFGTVPQSGTPKVEAPAKPAAPLPKSNG